MQASSSVHVQPFVIPAFMQVRAMLTLPEGLLILRTCRVLDELRHVCSLVDGRAIDASGLVGAYNVNNKQQKSQ